MPKSLGMIHTVNYSFGSTAGIGLDANQVYGIDLPGQLTNQLQRMVRAGGYFKVVGIDMSLNNIAGTIPADVVNVSGVIKFYAPTAGRCNALKNAYKAVRNGMKLAGISLHGNRHYDFRVPITDMSAVINGAAFVNEATIDGTNCLTLDTSAAAVNDEVFTVYNSNIQPEQSATVQFSEGFGLPGGGAGTDFVLNEGELYEGSLTHFAETTKEEIPFDLSYGMDSTTNTASVVSMEWRPDPALYLAVLTGQLEVHIIGMAAAKAEYRLNTAIHVAGWKSVLGNRRRR